MFSLTCPKRQSNLFLIELIFKCAIIILFKLSFQNGFNVFCQFISDWPDPCFSKSNMKKLQSELLPANCHLKTFEICCIKVLLSILAPLLSQMLSLDSFTMINKENVLFFYTSLFKSVLTSILFLSKSGLSILIISSEMVTSQVSDFNLPAISKTFLSTSVGVESEIKSFVATCRIK